MVAKLRLRKDDQVQVTTGRDKGKTGRILTVNPKRDHVLVEQVHMIKRHTRPDPSKQIRGGIVEKESPIHISNIALICTECGPTRIQVREKAAGKKVRICVNEQEDKWRQGF